MQALLKRVETGRGRLNRDGSAEFAGSAVELGLVQDDLGKHIKVNIGVESQFLDGLSKMGEGTVAVGYGMKEDGDEDVLVFDLAHRGNTTEVALYLRKGVADGCVINKSDVKDLQK